MFPSDIDLNDLAVASMETSTVKATIGATTLGRSPYFDWRKRRFIFNSGFNRECTLTESIQQHIRLFINTVKNKYAIYDRYFGVDTNGLVGYRLPRSVAIATIKRQISDDLLKTCPVVKETKDWTFSGQTGIFSFTAVMHDGTEIEVNENVYD
ncbi:DUF2634 domain-containing protein [Acidaminococcus intestini]|jgi:hypothetical protein|uniref:DUF2634 domain-containing protein n=1 Tax=Acidaminococcus intestini TaxID=187327 RepID=UPI0004790B6C|nr:DUF2634 domain-containing protein [Acidaminococcus intestini]MBS5582647.1 DUF2634 domain-containing protein [Megasphaera sp.]DAH03718.1 MAG TPA: Protein of unknown function (DUF2634) [Caudoviricetes sp.]